jgi:hypothetical protein
MSLVLALKNRTSLVVASDTDDLSDGTIEFGSFMNVPGRAILLMCGDLESARHAVETNVLPALNAQTSAATLAQVVQAALRLEASARLAASAGRLEVIVAGIDPVRHIELPGIYYLDSSTEFALTAVAQDVAAAGSTAIVAQMLQGRSLARATPEELTMLAKECLANTKLRWPAAMGTHQRLGIIKPDQIRIIEF